MGHAALGAFRELVSRWAAGATHERAHLVEAGVEHLLASGDATATRDATACRKRGTPHDARGPDVAVDAALVAEAVGEAGFPEQFVEFGLMRRRDLRADFGNTRSVVYRWLAFSGNGDADGPEKCVGQLERCGLD